MSNLTIVARPYAKAAFDFAVGQNALAAWADMLFFAAEVAKNPLAVEQLSSNGAADTQAAFFIQVCGEQLNTHGQNLIKLMAENQRLLALPAVFEEYLRLKAEYEKK